VAHLIVGGLICAHQNEHNPTHTDRSCPKITVVEQAIAAFPSLAGIPAHIGNNIKYYTFAVFDRS
jgi:hypothetical protein